MGNKVLLTVNVFLACVIFQANAQQGHTDLHCKTYCNFKCSALANDTERENCEQVQSSISRCKCNVGYYVGLVAGLCLLITIFCCCCQCFLRRRQAQGSEGHLPTGLLGFPVFDRRNDNMDNENIYVIPIPSPPPKYEDLDKFPVTFDEPPPPSYSSLAIVCEKA